MSRVLLITALCTAISAGSLVHAQATANEVTPKAHPIPSAQDISNGSPFSETGQLPLRAEIRPADAMSTQDKELEANSEQSIRERAGYQDLGFNEGNWKYSQVDCPGFPQHLFLRFTRNGGRGDVSVFTASIPRNGEGHIRIIPILRRSYSLFSPAPVNAMTVAAFNGIRKEETTEGKPEWAAMGVCYAALAGFQGTPAGRDSNTMEVRATLSPLLQVEKNEAIVTFATGEKQMSEWSMIFNRKGRLLKATHKRVQSADSSEPRVVKLKSPPIPQNHAASDTHPIAANPSQSTPQ